MSFRRSGSSSTRRMSPDALAMIVARLASASATTTAPAARTAATATSATATNAIPKQIALHRAQRLEFLDRRVRLLLLVPDRACPLGNLRLQHRGQLFDRRCPRVAPRNSIEKLERALVVLRRALRKRIEHGEPDAIVIGSLTPERLRDRVLLAAKIVRSERPVALQIREEARELLFVGRLLWRRWRLRGRLGFRHVERRPRRLGQWLGTDWRGRRLD